MAQCSTGAPTNGNVLAPNVLEPFQYLVHEQAKSIVAIQELQQEVNSLLLFRKAVLAALPHLEQQQRQQQPPGNPVKTTAATAAVTPLKLSPSWTRQRSYEAPAAAVVDSGFSTEANSNTSPRSSRLEASQSDAGIPATSSPMEKVLAQHLKRVRNRIARLRKDENRLLNLLRHAQSASSSSASSNSSSETDLAQGAGKKDELWQLLEDIEQRGREMHSRIQSVDSQPVSEKDQLRVILERLEKDLEHLRHRQRQAEEDLTLAQRRCDDFQREVQTTRLRVADAEKQVKVVMDKLLDTGEETLRHQPGISSPKTAVTVARVTVVDPSVKDVTVSVNGSNVTGSGIKKKVNFQEGVVRIAMPGAQIGSHAPAVKYVRPNREKVSAVLRLSNPIQLQRYLIHAVVENEVLREQMGRAQQEVTSRDAFWQNASHETAQQMTQLKEENEDLRFQLMEQKIELEGTKARLRLLSRSPPPPPANTPPTPAAAPPVEKKTSSCQTDPVLANPIRLNSSTQTEVLVDRSRSLPRVVDASPKVKLIPAAKLSSSATESGLWDDEERPSVERRSYGSSRIPTPIKPVKTLSKRELPHVASLSSINSQQQSLKGRRSKEKDTPPATPPNKNAASRSASTNRTSDIKAQKTEFKQRIYASDKVNGNFLPSSLIRIRKDLQHVADYSFSQSSFISSGGNSLSLDN